MNVSSNSGCHERTFKVLITVNAHSSVLFHLKSLRKQKKLTLKELKTENLEWRE